LNSRTALRVRGFLTLGCTKDRSERAYLRSSSFSAERVNGILDKLSQKAGGRLNLFEGSESRSSCESSASACCLFRLCGLHFGEVAMRRRSLRLVNEGGVGSCFILPLTDGGVQKD
jgi:hypothetical protein